jgi:ribosomal protein L11 methyltransferase
MTVATTKDKKPVWHALDVTVEESAREAIEYGLMEAGALGTETNSGKEHLIDITGYFDHVPNSQEIQNQLFEALRIYSVPRSSLRRISSRKIEDRDWLAEWKKHWQPVAVGGFIIAPPWIEPASIPTTPAHGSDKTPIVIRINPGMAFGTGTHETTRLCLKAIEKYFHGHSFLDVGTGTGILAIAAARIIPDGYFEACDNDCEAIAIAKENAEFNQVAERIHFRCGSIDEQTPSADLVCANLTAPLIVELLPSLLGASCGRLILSGILDSQIEMVQTRLLELGAADLEFDRDGEWVSIVV